MPLASPTDEPRPPRADRRAFMGAGGGWKSFVGNRNVTVGQWRGIRRTKRGRKVFQKMREIGRGKPWECKENVFVRN